MAQCRSWDGLLACKSQPPLTDLSSATISIRSPHVSVPAWRFGRSDPSCRVLNSPALLTLFAQQIDILETISPGRDDWQQNRHRLRDRILTNRCSDALKN